MKLPDQARQAPAQPKLWLVLKSFSETALLWFFFLWLLPRWVARLEADWFGWRVPSVPEVPCWIAFWVMGLTGFYCGMLFVVIGRGTPLPLEASHCFFVLGPYRFVRNPMALLGIGQGVIVGLLLRSPAACLLAIVGGVAWHVSARPWEERDMRRRYGAAYEQYCSRVRNWVPNLRPHPVLILEDCGDSTIEQ